MELSIKELQILHINLDKRIPNIKYWFLARFYKVTSSKQLSKNQYNNIIKLIKLKKIDSENQIYKTFKQEIDTFYLIDSYYKKKIKELKSK